MQALISQLLKLCVTAMISHEFISFSAVQIYDLSYIHLYNISCHIFFGAIPEEVTQKLPLWTLRGTKSAFITLKKHDDEHHRHLYMGVKGNCVLPFLTLLIFLEFWFLRLVAPRCIWLQLSFLLAALCDKSFELYFYFLLCSCFVESYGWSKPGSEGVRRTVFLQRTGFSKRSLHLARGAGISSAGRCGLGTTLSSTKAT